MSYDTLFDRVYSLVNNIRQATAMSQLAHYADCIPRLRNEMLRNQRTGGAIEAALNLATSYRFSKLLELNPGILPMEDIMHYRKLAHRAASRASNLIAFADPDGDLPVSLLLRFADEQYNATREIA